MSHASQTPVTLPPSISNNGINIVGIICFFAAAFYCRAQGFDGVKGTLICLFAYGLVIALLEVILLRSPARPSTGLDFRQFNWSADRVFYKLVGLAACYGGIALIYWQADVYRNGMFQPYWDTLAVVMPYLAVLAVPYVAFVDVFMKEPEDNYYHLGRMLLTFQRGASWRAFSQLGLGWLVKGYFLPMMYVFMLNDVNYLVHFDISDNNITFLNLFHPIVSLLFVLDLLAAAVGYSFTLRLFDTHIRSAEPTFLGWFACLLCYNPFNDVYLRFYASYRGGEGRWIEWLQDNPYYLMLWGGVTFSAITMYAVTGVCYGLRFSNITHRGVITNGFFRVTKHPQYISKNFYWWMTFVPFMCIHENDGTWQDSIRYSCLMLIVSTVYFLRARTEERHLSRDPDYVRYALWMNENAALSWLGKMIPFFRYKAPENWQNLPPYNGIK